MEFVPQGFNEQEVLDIIEDVVKKLASPFKFGFHDASDMKQEGRIFALEALAAGKFDAARGTLRTFLTNVIRNRFINMKRDKLQRQHPPCSSCPFFNSQRDLCSAFATRDECEKWSGWRTRNTAKRNLMEGYNPHQAGENSGDETSITGITLEQMANQEIIRYVDKKLPIVLRADYCKMMTGIKLPKSRREFILDTVRAIVKEGFPDHD